MSIIPHRATFLETVSAEAFNGTIEQDQAAGINALLDCWDRKPELQDPRWLAYMLATMRFETAGEMQPVTEPGRGYGYAYGVPHPDTGQCYYGRGYVPLQWHWNYNSWGKNLSKDFANNPDLLLQPDIAATVAVEGMKHGLFTGIALSDHIDGEKEDILRARQCVNARMQGAEEVAAFYPDFLRAINSVR